MNGGIWADLDVSVWWVPQIPMEAFRVEVPTFDEAFRLTSTLANYDLFQLKHRVKPDYCNAGGVAYRHPAITEGEWYDIEEDEVDDLFVELARVNGGGSA